MCTEKKKKFMILWCPHVNMDYNEMRILCTGPDIIKEFETITDAKSCIKILYDESFNSLPSESKTDEVLKYQYGKFMIVPIEEVFTVNAKRVDAYYSELGEIKNNEESSETKVEECEPISSEINKE